MSGDFSEVVIDDRPHHPRTELHTLTSLRFCAAVAVFIAHAAGLLITVHPQHGNFHWMLTRMQEGRAGVAFFFVLSGFILTYNYRENLSSATKRYQFWWARFARIYPLHILTFLLAVVPFVYAHSDWSPTLLSEIGIAHILLLQAWLPVAGDKYVTAFNGPSWTLSVEAFFYLSFPLWIVVADRLAKRFWRLPAMIIVVWLVVVGAQLLWGTPSFGNWATSINPLALSVEFFAGIGLGYIYHRYRIEVKSQFQFARWWWVPVVVLLATIVWAPTYVSLPVRDMAVYLPCMVAIIWMMALQDDTTFALARKRWHRLGEASFAFYMLHIVVFLWTVDPINKLWHPSTWIIICVLMADFVLTLMLSLGVFQWFETPMRKWLRQRITFG